MADMREYKGTIRDAVRQERNADKNWTWKVKAINKDHAHIGWGYLDYLGEEDDFLLEFYDEDQTAVVGTMPNGNRKYALVGGSPWDDAKTIEGAISIVIHAMAQTAHNIY